jgi:hypothetical protein
MYVRLGRYASVRDDLETFKRDEDIVIHRYDTWNMDHTLALLIVPLLKQLKATKHGAPHVDSEDVPLELAIPPNWYEEKYRVNGETDPNFFKRWDYVMDEMIWAFEQIIDDDAENKFYDHSEVDDNEPDINKRVKNLKVDDEGLKKYHDRINNGTRLFGKYYRSLWD